MLRELAFPVLETGLPKVARGEIGVIATVPGSERPESRRLLSALFASERPAEHEPERRRDD
jgi:hypothetical protein